MNNKTFSIIIPVCNTSEYLRQCLDSILNQTYADFEAICINDCSTDNSLGILEEYASKDKRIVIINNDVNKGLGASRNLAIQKATGKYLALLDSDDWVREDWLEKVYKAFQKSDVQSVIYKYYDVYKNECTEFDNKIKDKEMQKSFREQVVNVDASNIEIYETRSCNKVYNLDIVKKEKILYQENLPYENVLFHYHFYIKNSRAYVLDEYLYYYRRDNPNSILNSIKSNSMSAMKDRFIVMENWYNLIKKIDPSYLFVVKNRMDSFLKNSFNSTQVSFLCKKYKAKFKFN